MKELNSEMDLKKPKHNAQRKLTDYQIVYLSNAFSPKQLPQSTSSVEMIYAVRHSLNQYTGRVKTLNIQWITKEKVKQWHKKNKNDG